MLFGFDHRDSTQMIAYRARMDIVQRNRNVRHYDVDRAFVFVLNSKKRRVVSRRRESSHQEFDNRYLKRFS